MTKTSSFFEEKLAKICFKKGKNNSSQSVYLLFKKRFTRFERLAMSVSLSNTEPSVSK